jgi:hypothetical protein
MALYTISGSGIQRLMIKTAEDCLVTRRPFTADDSVYPSNFDPSLKIEHVSSVPQKVDARMTLDDLPPSKVMPLLGSVLFCRLIPTSDQKESEGGFEVSGEAISSASMRRFTLQGYEYETS